MSYATLILGESGTGKTCSIRNFDPKKTLLIQPVRKPLPFPSKGWKERKSKDDDGNIFYCASGAIVNAVLSKLKDKPECPYDVIVIDDWQYILANEFMERRAEKGFQKFVDIGGVGFDVVRLASELQPNVRVYVLAHTDTSESGVTKIKTLGRMLDEKIVIEGLFTTVLKTYVENGKYFFTTQNSGSDTVKSPMGLFSSNLIENDLNAVDTAICNYYGITK